MQRQEEDERRGVNGYGKGAGRGQPTLTVGQHLTWWLVLVIGGLFLLGLILWLVLGAAMVADMRALLEATPLESSLQAEPGELGGNPLPVVAATGTVGLILVVVMTRLIRAWRRGWARSKAGRFRLVVAGLTLNLVRTALVFVTAAACVAGVLVAGGADLDPDVTLPGYPRPAYLAIMAVPVLVVSWPLAGRSWRQAWVEVERLREAGHRW